MTDLPAKECAPRGVDFEYSGFCHGNKIVNKITFHIKKMSELTTYEINNLIKLSYVNGGMRQVVANTKDHHKVKICYVMKNDKYIGWSLVKKYITKQPPMIMVYVKSNYRRRGFGKELVKRLRSNIRKKVHCLPWNEPGFKLFESLNIEFGSENIFDLL